MSTESVEDAEKAKSAMFFATKISVADDLDLYKKTILLHSAVKYLRGEKPTLIRDQLALALAFYFKYGYSPETKDLMRDVMCLKDREAVNLINHELKKNGYLIDVPHKKLHKELAPDLQSLKDYIDITNKKSPKTPTYKYIHFIQLEQ